MTALRGGPPPTESGPPHPHDDPVAGPATGSAGADRTLHAQDADRVFQAARDQYIVQSAAAPSAPAKVTNTLPRDTRAFTGRNDELNALIATIIKAVQSGEVVPVYSIDGMPGVGKTALAVHVGHLLAPYFPDAQLFLDMRAHAAGQRPVDPSDALAELLSTDGVHHKQIPPGLDERAAMWRARMADKRTLLILDNVAGYAQVEPLLPGAPGCSVLITSRRRLRGLRARHAAERLPLETLPSDQAVALLIELAGRPLSEDEVPTAAKLVELCGYLPLAIGLLAAKLGPEPLWRVTDLVEAISASRDPLAHMRAEETTVAVSFDLSYRDLPGDLQRFFRRLSLNPGEEIEPLAAATLDGVGLGAARRNLDALFECHLVEQRVLGRFRMHDLIAGYAGRLVANDPPAEREEAIDRVLDYYEHAATLADRHLARRHRNTGVSPALPSPSLMNYEQAMRWMDAERANLLACAAHARSRGLKRRIVGFAATLAAYLYRTGPWHQAIALHRDAADAADQLGDRTAQADALFEMSVLLRHTGAYAQAEEILRNVLANYDRLGQRLRAADTLAELGAVYRLSGDFRRAADILRRALAMYRELKDRGGQARCLNALATVQYITDDFPRAVESLEASLSSCQDDTYGSERAKALFLLGVVRRLTDDYPGATQVLLEASALCHALNDRLEEANVKETLGVVRRMTGDYTEAEELLRGSITTYVHLGDRLGRANAVKQLGAVHRLTGNYPAAMSALGEALALYDDLDDRFGRANALASLGVTQRLAGDADAAAQSLYEALSIYSGLSSRLGQAEVLNAIGALLLDRNDVAGALTQHELALELAIEAHSLLERARALKGIAQCSCRRHDLEGAVVHLRESVRILRSIGAPEAAQAAVDLASMEAGLGRP